MSKYRKKPIVVEAHQLREVQIIETLEGTMRGEIGDWLIVGVNGEKYPCKDDIFRKSYEPVVVGNVSVARTAMATTSDNYVQSSEHMPPSA